MVRDSLIGLSLVTFILALGSCGEDSPSSPTGLSAPTIQSPEIGATVQTLQPTLSVGNATGGVGEATYRFEVSKDSNFSQSVAADEGISQGSGGTTSWKVPVVLDGNATYYWRARASASGETGPYSPTANFRTYGGFTVDEPGADGLIVFDPLTNGMSVGQVRGGVFNSKGWMATAANTYIRYAVPTITDGFVEFDVTGLRNPNPVSQKRSLMIMWDPTAGEYTTNRFRMHLAKFDTRLVDHGHLRLRFISQGQEANDEINLFQWDPNRVYHWRVEWGKFPSIVSTHLARVLLDGVQVLICYYDLPYQPRNHWIELGMGPRNETLEQAIFSNVQIGVRRP